ncbi:hypothetical protein C8Q76DRAFT_414169 [Earliella scabrosa]|nr:hypothetical protein C8Q76DRAFT_414169 [Earliella scabrosa]
MAGRSPICFGSFRFPREVEYAIIDHLADDSPTLASCALVCRAWRSPSQSLNLRSVTLRVTDTSDAILFEFLRFLKPAPEAATHIRSLQIHGGGPSHARHTTIWLTTLHKYLSLLPRLKQLTFCFISFLYDLQDSAPSWLYAHGCPPPGRPCVDMISLTECRASTRDLIELFFMFSGIDHLRMSGGEWPDVQSGSILLPRSSQRTPAVRALTLGAVVPETLCALIQNSRSPNGNVASTLRVLRLLPPKAFQPESLLGAFRTYLTHFTRCLVELHLNACALVEQAHSLNATPGNNVHRPSLNGILPHSFPALHSLVLWIEANPESLKASEDRGVSYISDVLEVYAELLATPPLAPSASGARPAPLASVTFMIHPGGPEVVNALSKAVDMFGSPIETLDAALAALRALRRVEFVLKVTEAYRDILGGLSGRPETEVPRSGGERPARGSS